MLPVGLVVLWSPNPVPQCRRSLLQKASLKKGQKAQTVYSFDHLMDIGIGVRQQEPPERQLFKNDTQVLHATSSLATRVRSCSGENPQARRTARAKDRGDL